MLAIANATRQQYKPFPVNSWEVARVQNGDVGSISESEMRFRHAYLSRDMIVYCEGGVFAFEFEDD
jgi:hypothetical protein